MKLTIILKGTTTTCAMYGTSLASCTTKPTAMTAGGMSKKPTTPESEDQKQQQLSKERPRAPRPETPTV